LLHAGSQDTTSATVLTPGVALQTSDANRIATPEDWQPGDRVIVPPPADMDAAEARMNEGHECTDWYFCKKAL
jgi:peroxiredoxin (alkyl hydroperoxide reductase subunit C)